MQKSGMKHKNLAAALGMNASSQISKYLAGIHIPESERITEIAEILNIPEMALYDIEPSGHMASLEPASELMSIIAIEYSGDITQLKLDGKVVWQSSTVGGTEAKASFALPKALARYVVDLLSEAIQRDQAKNNDNS